MHGTDPQTQQSRNSPAVDSRPAFPGWSLANLLAFAALGAVSTMSLQRDGFSWGHMSVALGAALVCGMNLRDIVALRRRRSHSGLR